MLGVITSGGEEKKPKTKRKLTKRKLNFWLFLLLNIYNYIKFGLGLFFPHLYNYTDCWVEIGETRGRITSSESKTIASLATNQTIINPLPKRVREAIPALLAAKSLSTSGKYLLLSTWLTFWLFFTPETAVKWLNLRTFVLL